MLPVMFGSLEVATMPASAPAAAHIVLSIGFAPLAGIAVAPLPVALLLFRAMRATSSKTSASLRASKLDLVEAPVGTQLSK